MVPAYEQIPKRLQTFAGGRKEPVCPNCLNTSIIITDSANGDELCSKCGLILESRIMSMEQEWRSFAPTDGGSGIVDKSRVGGPNDVWLQDGSVQGTAMMGGDKKYTRLAQTHEMATGLAGGDKMIKTAFANIRLITEYFNLRENIVERCKDIVKDLQVADQLRSRTSELYMLSVVYLACREEQTPRSLKELVTYNRSLKEKDLGRAINRLKKSLPPRNQPMAVASIDLMPQICQSLQLSQDVATTSATVSKRAHMYISKTYRTNAIAAGCVYLITQLCQLGIDVYDIAMAARTSASTVISVYRELLPISKEVLPPTFNPTKS